jgi:hypothetical protein
MSILAALLIEGFTVNLNLCRYCCRLAAYLELAAVIH